MRQLIRRIVRYKFTAPKQRDIIKQYDKRIEQLQKMQDSPQKDVIIQKITNQFGNRLKQVKREEQLLKIKNYLMEGFQNNQKLQQQSNIETQQSKSYIPNNLVVRKLRFMDRKVLLLGIQQQNDDHCIYVKKIAEKLSTKIILTALPPDMPYFIKTELSFVEQWRKFVTDPKKTRQSKFYLNPSPFHISDICLSRNQIQLVRNSLNKSKQFNQIFYTILQLSKSNKSYLPNGLLTPLLVSCVQKIYFCDYPLLKQRQFWALNVPIQKMRDLFKIYHRQISKDKKLIFDPRILFPRQVIAKKFQYMVNAIKYSTYETKQPAIFVCPAQYVELFCFQWKLDKPVTPYSNFIQDKNNKKMTTFLDFVQKLVIMDIILQPVLDKYFIKNLSFPYTALQTLGGKENIGRIFIVWNHFKNIYKDALTKQPI